jgi:hypothetical protein
MSDDENGNRHGSAQGQFGDRERLPTGFLATTTRWRASVEPRPR